MLLGSQAITGTTEPVSAPPAAEPFFADKFDAQALESPPMLLELDSFHLG